MTTRRDETPVRRRAKAASPDRFTAWLVWPVSTVLFGGLAMLLASAVSSERARTTDDLWNAIRTLGRWAEPAFSSGFDALAVFGTIVVAVAAITGFSGDWSGLIARARSLLSALTVLASILLLGLATLTPAVIVASPETSSETILLWLAGWGVMLVTLAISEVMPLRSQVVLARVRAVRAERRAERAGYDLPPRHASPPARPTGALITLLAAPVVLWVIFSTSVAATMHVSERTAVLFVFVGYGGLITLIGWWAGNDATAPRLSRVFAVFIVTTGVIMTFALALSLATVWAPISIGLLINGVASLLFLLPLTVTRRMPLLGRVQEWRTFLSLHLLRDRSEAMQRQWIRNASPREHRSSLWTRVLRVWGG